MRFIFALTIALSLAFCPPSLWAQPGGWEQTEREMQQVLEKDPNNLEALQRYANLALGAHQMAVAMQLAGRILQLQPKNLFAQLILVKASMASGDVSQSRTYIDRARQMAPEDVEALELDGLVSLLQGNAVHAVELLEKSLQGAGGLPLSSQARCANSLIAALQQSQQLALAVQKCELFLQKYPDYGDLYISASRLYRETGDFPRALQSAQRGLAKFPELYNLYASIALAQSKLGNRPASEEAYAQLLKHSPSVAASVRRILDGQQPDAAELQVDVK